MQNFVILKECVGQRVKLYSCFTKDCSIRIICVQYTKSVCFIRVVAIAFCKNCLDYTCQIEVRAGQ